MNIFYADISDDITPLETSFTFAEDGETVEVKRFRGELIKTGESSYFLRGDMDFVFRCPCDRCMAETVIEIAQSVSVNIEPVTNETATGKKDEHEMTDDEGDVYFTSAEFIDLNDILRQEALLQLPLKRLCGADCECPEGDIDDEKPLCGLEALKKIL